MWLRLYLFDFSWVDDKHHVVDGDARLGDVGGQNLEETTSYDAVMIQLWCSLMATLRRNKVNSEGGLTILRTPGGAVFMALFWSRVCMSECSVNTWNLREDTSVRDTTQCAAGLYFDFSATYFISFCIILKKHFCIIFNIFVYIISYLSTTYKRHRFTSSSSLSSYHM